MWEAGVWQASGRGPTSTEALGDERSRFRCDRNRLGLARSKGRGRRGEGETRLSRTASANLRVH